VHKLSEVCLAIDYLDGDLDGNVSEGELALIYSVLPDLLLDVLSGNGIVAVSTLE
jgi:hypothetical protein